jgi:hypothetical protein
MDLTMIEEGNPDEIDGLINFQKLSMVYQVIEKVQRYQQVLLHTITHTHTHTHTHNLPPTYKLMNKSKIKNKNKQIM